MCTVLRAHAYAVYTLKYHFSAQITTIVFLLWRSYKSENQKSGRHVSNIFWLPIFWYPYRLFWVIFEGTGNRGFLAPQPLGSGFFEKSWNTCKIFLDYLQNAISNIKIGKAVLELRDSENNKNYRKICKPLRLSP